jgi:hypothetical protein
MGVFAQFSVHYMGKTVRKASISQRQKVQRKLSMPDSTQVAVLKMSHSAKIPRLLVAVFK